MVMLGWESKEPCAGFLQMPRAGWAWDKTPSAVNAAIQQVVVVVEENIVSHGYVQATLRKKIKDKVERWLLGAPAAAGLMMGHVSSSSVP